MGSGSETFFFLSPKRRVLGKKDQAQKVLKMVPFPHIWGKKIHFPQKNYFFPYLAKLQRIRLKYTNKD